MEKKKDLYIRIKIAGIVSFIPFVLISGPLCGYFAGEYITKKFALHSYVTIALMCLGLAAGITETIRIIKLLIKTDKESKTAHD